ncbi:MAG: UvrD-helicase domain-containing protein [Fusobacteriota bacterium]
MNKKNSIQSTFNYKSTKEQKKILKNNDKHSVVVAYPGTGKTTTILMDCHLKSDKNKIILTFNKKIQKEIQKKIKLLDIKNTRVYTIHALAYKYEARKGFGHNFKYNTFNIYTIFYHKDFNLNFSESKTLYNSYIGFLRSNFIDSKKYFQEIYLKSNEDILEPKVINLLINSYKAIKNKSNLSNDEKEFLNIVKLKNSPEIYEKYLLENHSRLKKRIQNLMYLINKIKLYSKIKNIAKNKIVHKYGFLINKVFKKMSGKVNKRNKFDKVPQTHDFYLKKFSLSNQKFDNIDFLYLDEAHDSNPITISMIYKKFPNAIYKIFGDPNQSIYKWRGAINALDNFSQNINTQKFFLTWSFRYGQKIAKKANEILKIKNNLINGKKIIGKNSNENINEPFPHDEQILVIGRTNIGIIEFAMENSKHKIYFSNKLDTRIYEDIKKLKSNNLNKIKTKNIKKYKSFKKLQYAIEKNIEIDQEIIITYNLIKKKSSIKLDKIIKKLNNNYNKKDCKFLCTTAHKSKGLESHNVIKLNDFIDLDRLKYERNLLINNSTNKDINNNDLERVEEEINLHYVAITRAKKRLKEIK